jgi:hypothetical protein
LFYDHLRWLAALKLRTHFLQTGSKRFNLLFLSVGAWDISFLFPCRFDSVICRSGSGEQTSGERVLCVIQDRLTDAEFGRNLASLSNQFALSTAQLVIRRYGRGA